jgi:hypothetical protein
MPTVNNGGRFLWGSASARAQEGNWEVRFHFGGSGLFVLGPLYRFSTAQAVRHRGHRASPVPLSSPRLASIWQSGAGVG